MLRCEVTLNRSTTLNVGWVNHQTSLTLSLGRKNAWQRASTRVLLNFICAGRRCRYFLVDHRRRWRRFPSGHPIDLDHRSGVPASH